MQLVDCVIFQSSRKLNCKDLIKDFLSLICGMGQFLAGLGNEDSNLKFSTANSSKDCSHVITIPLLEAGDNASLAMQKLLIMVIIALFTARIR